MGDFSKFIDPARRAVPAPKTLVKLDRTAVYGTFDKEIRDLDLTGLNRPTALPNFCNRLKLSLWEAAEVHLKNGVLLTAVSDMGLFGKTLVLFYDKRDHKTYCWEQTLPVGKVTIAPNLLRGAQSRAAGRGGFLLFANHFEVGQAHLRGHREGRCLITTPRKNMTAVDARKKNTGTASIDYSFSLSRLSLPSVVSIPFDASRPRPLYSQKDFFKAEGSLKINGEEMLTDEDSTAIIDDHRGYYPRRSHYDWVTTLGRFDTDRLGHGRFFALNLTRNQSINQEKYNENLLWLEGKTSLLPPVKFSHSFPTSEFRDYAEWRIQDAYDMVNLKFRIRGLNPMVLHAFFVNIDYFVTFGSLVGYVRDEDGKAYHLDGCLGIGEDKTLLF